MDEISKRDVFRDAYLFLYIKNHFETLMSECEFQSLAALHIQRLIYIVVGEAVEQFCG